MKKIKIYLESSALWNLYYEEKGGRLVEQCLENQQLTCISSIWSQLELERGIKKRENQEEINAKEAEYLRVFITTDCKRLISKKQLLIIPIIEEYILMAKKFIQEYNLYASDALHLATAVLQDCKGILVDDYHFKRLNKKVEINEGIAICPTIFTLAEFRKKLDL